MKTIKEGLDDAYKKAGQNAYFGNGFEAGVNFAQRWIPIEEELPEKQGRYLVKMKTKHQKGFDIVVMNFYNDDKTFSCRNSIYSTANITHWRPIEYL